MKFLPLFLASSVKSEINCSDGNNGGCSHFCNAAEKVCECPPCWTLRDDDDATCVPDPQKMEITCDQTGMSLTLASCIYTSQPGDIIYLTFNNETDASCASKRYHDYHTISTPLDDCMTEMVVEEDEIVFKNTIRVKSRYNYNSIVMNSDVNIDAQCRFPAFVSDVSSDSFDNSPATVQAGANGNAYFHFDAAFYTDANFSEETNDEQMVGEKVYFGITQSTGINGLSFIVHDCYVRNYHDSQYFYVFENFCPNEIVNNDEVVPEFETTDMFKLSYHAFQFSGNYDKEVVQMLMDCSIEVCLFGTCPVVQTPCS